MPNFENVFNICTKNYLNFIIEKDSITLHELYNKKNKFAKPNYQRAIVWEIGQQSRLIESLFLNIPLPSIFLIQKKNKLYIIDGQQRINTIFKFLDNNLELGSLKILKDLKKQKFNNLDENLKTLIGEKVVNCITIIPLEESEDSNSDMERLIFERLNTGGTKLTPNQIRKALYCDSKLYSVINKIEEILNLKNEKKHKKIIFNDYQYNIPVDLDQIISSCFSISKYKNFSPSSLGKIFNNYNELSDTEINELANKFITILQHINRGFEFKNLIVEKKINLIRLYTLYMFFDDLIINNKEMDIIIEQMKIKKDKIITIFKSKGTKITASLIKECHENIVRLLKDA